MKQELDVAPEFEKPRSSARPQPAAPDPAALAELFARLSQQWREETRLHSSVTSMAMHPAYQRIIGLGTPALPLILQALESNRGHWFWALRAISGEDPVPEESRGDVPAMTAAWLEWGRKNGLLSDDPAHQPAHA